MADTTLRRIGEWLGNVIPWVIGLFPIWLLPVVLLSRTVFPPSDEEQLCAEMEYIAGQAGRCLANPTMWKTWARMDELYGGDNRHCDYWVDQLGYLNVSADLVRDAAEWTDAHDGTRSFRQYWDQELGQDFCSEAVRWKL